MVTGVAPFIIGVTTVFLPGRCRMASGTRTVMLVAVVTLRPLKHPAKWR